MKNAPLEGNGLLLLWIDIIVMDVGSSTKEYMDAWVTESNGVR